MILLLLMLPLWLILGAELKREEIEYLVIKLIVDSVLVRSLSMFIVLCQIVISIPDNNMSDKNSDI